MVAAAVTLPSAAERLRQHAPPPPTPTARALAAALVATAVTLPSAAERSRQHLPTPAPPLTPARVLAAAIAAAPPVRLPSAAERLRQAAKVAQVLATATTAPPEWRFPSPAVTSKRRGARYPHDQQTVANPFTAQRLRLRTPAMLTLPEQGRSAGCGLRKPPATGSRT